MSVVRTYVPLIPRQRIEFGILMEEVCKKGGITEDYPWIKIQRKISRRCRDPNKYFTVKMMRNVSRVTKKITGLNPDINHERQLTNWLKDHKRRVYTEEERRIFAKRLRKNISNQTIIPEFIRAVAISLAKGKVILR